MGVLPLSFTNGQTRKSLNITGDETVDIIGINDDIKAKQILKAVITKADGSKKEIDLLCRLDTSNEVEYYKAGGILQFVLNSL